MFDAMEVYVYIVAVPEKNPRLSVDRLSVVSAMQITTLFLRSKFAWMQAFFFSSTLINDVGAASVPEVVKRP